MPKILALDYGKRRTGLALSDESKIFAFGYGTQDTKALMIYLDGLFQKERIDTLLVGMPKKLNNEDAEISTAIRKFIQIFKEKHTAIIVVEWDERFTSKMAMQSMVESGMKKKDRQNKATIDEVSATILLQSYLETL